MGSTVDPYWDMPSPRAIRFTDIQLKMNWKFCLSKHWAQLHSVYCFRITSPLLVYVREYFPTAPFQVKLIDVIWALTEIIQMEELLDPFNPYMVICSTSLKLAMKCPSFHVAQLRELLLQNLHLVKRYKGPKPSWLDREHLIDEEYRLFEEAAKLPHDEKRFDPTKRVYLSTEVKVDIDDTLREFLIGTGKFEEKDEGYPYREIVGFLKWYLHEHRNALIDYKNHEVFNIKDDPLKKVFLCQAFHRCQLSEYLSLHLYPRMPKSDPLPTPTSSSLE
jgi:hypothetical protein